MSDQTVEPYFELAAPDGTIVAADDIDDLTNWVKLERESWAWLTRSLNQNIGVAEDYRSLVGKHLDQAWSLLQTPEADGRRNIGAIKSALDQYVRLGLASTRPRAQYIAKIQSDHGDTAASAAVAQFLGSVWNSYQTVPRESRHSVDVGRTAAQLFDLGTSALGADAYRAAAQKMTDSFKSRLNKYSADAREELSGIKTEREQARSDHANFVKESNQTWETALNRINSEVAASVDQIIGTEKAFKEQMKLRSSVQYWMSKSREHRRRAHAQKAIIAAYAAIVGIVGVCVIPDFFKFVGATAVELRDSSATPLFLLTGASVLAISVALWVARMLVRVYLDERNRSLDAAERAVMAETYCALTSENLVSESERILVLSSLFRPTGESSHKDDGPDTLQHAILAKLLDTKGARI